jgi:hypothetical protein
MRSHDLLKLARFTRFRKKKDIRMCVWLADRQRPSQLEATLKADALPVFQNADTSTESNEVLREPGEKVAHISTDMLAEIPKRRIPFFTGRLGSSPAGEIVLMYLLTARIPAIAVVNKGLFLP